MKLKTIIEINNNLKTDIGSIKVRFLLRHNKSILEPIVKMFYDLYNENQGSINNNELEELLNMEIDIPLIYLTIDDIPEDIGILSKKEMDAIFSLVK